MKIICMACPPGSPEIAESKYLEHMESVHGGSQATAKAKEQNLPAQTVGEGIAPSPEFMEIAQMMDKPKTAPPDAKPEPKVLLSKGVSGNQLQEVRKLELRYQWIGNCPQCNAPVRTIIVNPSGKTVVVAYCLSHNEVEQREVPSLDAPVKLNAQEQKENPLIERKERKVRKYVKRAKSSMGKERTEPNAMQPARMQTSSQESV